MNDQIYEYNEQYRRWVQIEALQSHTNTINDVSWAPNLGRSYHLLASASKDQKVKIFKIQVLPEKYKIDIKEVASFDDHHSEVWTSYLMDVGLMIVIGVES